MLFLEDYFLEEEIKTLVDNNYYRIIGTEIIEEQPGVIQLALLMESNTLFWVEVKMPANTLTVIQHLKYSTGLSRIYRDRDVYYLLS